METWNAGRRSSMQPTAVAAAAEKASEARRTRAGRRSSVLVHPQAVQGEGSAHPPLPPMPQGTRTTRARSSGLAIPEASRCAADDGGRGATSRSSKASISGWDEKEGIRESAAVASAVEVEGSNVLEGCALHVAPRGSGQRGSRGGSLEEAATHVDDRIGDTVPSLDALPEGDEEDGRRVEQEEEEEEEGQEEVSQTGRDDGSRDQQEAGAGRGGLDSANAVAGAVSGQQGQGFVCREGGRDDGYGVDTEQKCKSTSVGAAKGGRRGKSGAAAVAKQRS
eukprot:scaffold162376_cov17-Tisochrysis_lutea.AAC.1